jgi:hypothetical protein
VRFLIDYKLCLLASVKRSAAGGWLRRPRRLARWCCQASLPRRCCMPTAR